MHYYIAICRRGCPFQEHLLLPSNGPKLPMIVHHLKTTLPYRTQPTSMDPGPKANNKTIPFLNITKWKEKKNTHTQLLKKKKEAGSWDPSLKFPSSLNSAQ